MPVHPNGVVRPSAKEPLFSFGVIADVQYADIPDGRSFLGVPRYYRHSIAVLRRAVQRWNGEKSVRFCINFGDIVDGFCPKDRSLAAVQAVVREFDDFRGGAAYHMLGNHCLYNLPRSELVSVLRMPSASPGRAYYDFSPWPGYRFVVLDAYDFSAVGWPRDHPVSFAARRFLEKRNPNHDKNSPSGLAGKDRRFVMFNGGVGDAQLRWLDGVLRRAARRGEKAVVCSHLPVHPGAASPTGLMWNYEEVMPSNALPANTRLQRIDFQPLVDKAVSKLTVWNGKNINHAGRSTLVKAVLTSQAMYCLTSLRAPKATLKEIDNLRKSFLWAGSEKLTGGNAK